jgi:hypothetical protein
MYQITIKTKRRLFLVVVFFLITNITFPQSKKEQIEQLRNQKDSLYKVVVEQLLINDQLNKNLVIANEENKLLQNDIQNLINKLKIKEIEKDSLKKQIPLTKHCLVAMLETSIKFNDSGEDPTIEKRAFLNGFELISNQDGFNNTYPNRLYGFKYKLIDSDQFIPGGFLFNENVKELEIELNQKVKSELLKQNVSASEIVDYFFSKKLFDDSEGKINFFIEFDKVIFYLEQFMYGQVNDRIEIEYSLNEVYPYLLNLDKWSLEEKKRYILLAYNNLNEKSNLDYELSNNKGLIECVEKEITNDKIESGSMFIRTCIYQNFKFVDSIYSDCLYPECFRYSFFKRINDLYEAVDLKDMFNEKRPLLEEEINSRSIKELNELKNIRSNKYDEKYKLTAYKNHTFNDAKSKIEFFSIDENGITFRTFIQTITNGKQSNKVDEWLLINFSFDEISNYWNN